MKKRFKTSEKNEKQFTKEAGLATWLVSNPIQPGK
jgi:hypothetical protein